MYYIIINSATYNAKQNRPANHWSIYDKNGEMATTDWYWDDESQNYNPVYNYSAFTSVGYTWTTGYKTAEAALKEAKNLTRGYPTDVIYGVTDVSGAHNLLVNGGRK